MTQVQPQVQEKVKGVVDIVFLVDCTGSMQPCIDALKKNIATFIDSLTLADANNACPVRDWRAKIVGYRDYEVDATPLIDHPFVRDVAALKTQLGALTAEGGGDEPESLLDALYKLATMGQTDKGSQSEDPAKWRYRSSAARVVIVFTDASYKEKLAIPEAKGGSFDDVCTALMSNRIILSVFAPQMPCYDRLSEIDKCSVQAYTYDTTVKDGAPQALQAFTADQEHFKDTLKQLARSVSKSAEVVTL